MKTKLNCEQLEGREMPAITIFTVEYPKPDGDVGQAIVVQGDDTANRVFVRENRDGSVSVNNRKVVTWDPHPLVWISTFGGNDFVVISGHLTTKVLAGDGNDVVRGGSGDDEIYGGAGRDILFGGRGRDYLEGGAGVDWLDGGLGADYVVAERHDHVRRDKRDTVVYVD